MTDPNTPQAAALTYPCNGCGARVQFAAGTSVMQCPYCGFQQQITVGERQIREIPFAALATLPRKPVGSIGAYVFVCQRCAAQTQTNETASICQFCGSPLVLDGAATGQIVPEAVLPFQLDRNAMRESMRKWTGSRWFAPTALKKVTETEATKGTYVPHWTYDSRTASSYSGARGEHYYVRESYTDNNGNRQTRQVRHTRWYPVQGSVWRAFDDVLVPASVVLPVAKLDSLAPWPLPNAVPYQPQYLAGYHALRYDVEPEPGFEEAKSRMAPIIADDCRHDIGGDEQRVEAVNTNYGDVTFKLMLLPVWIATYLYGGKNFQILVNALTGEVQGERPYSKAKIAIAVAIALIVVIAVIVLIASGHHTGSTPVHHTTSHH
jgi:DNA-directed RNA polymerase subunit RPC12/RpoP